MSKLSSPLAVVDRTLQKGGKNSHSKSFLTFHLAFVLEPRVHCCLASLLKDGHGTADWSRRGRCRRSRGRS